LFWVHFGGPGGIYLQHLIGISALLHRVPLQQGESLDSIAQVGSSERNRVFPCHSVLDRRSWWRENRDSRGRF
jgi:hypothetical protein